MFINSSFDEIVDYLIRTSSITEDHFLSIMNNSIFGSRDVLTDEETEKIMDHIKSDIHKSKDSFSNIDQLLEQIELVNFNSMHKKFEKHYNAYLNSEKRDKDNDKLIRNVKCIIVELKEHGLIKKDFASKLINFCLISFEYIHQMKEIHLKESNKVEIIPQEFNCKLSFYFTYKISLCDNPVSNDLVSSYLVTDKKEIEGELNYYNIKNNFLFQKVCKNGKNGIERKDSINYTKILDINYILEPFIDEVARKAKNDNIKFVLLEAMVNILADGVKSALLLRNYNKINSHEFQKSILKVQQRHIIDIFDINSTTEINSVIKSILKEQIKIISSIFDVKVEKVKTYFSKYYQGIICEPEKLIEKITISKENEVVENVKYKRNESILSENYTVCLSDIIKKIMQQIRQQKMYIGETSKLFFKLNYATVSNNQRIYGEDKDNKYEKYKKNIRKRIQKVKDVTDGTKLFEDWIDFCVIRYIEYYFEGGHPLYGGDSIFLYNTLRKNEVNYGMLFLSLPLKPDNPGDDKVTDILLSWSKKILINLSNDILWKIFHSFTPKKVDVDLMMGKVKVEAMRKKYNKKLSIAIPTFKKIVECYTDICHETNEKYGDRSYEFNEYKGMKTIKKQSYFTEEKGNPGKPTKPELFECFIIVLKENIKYFLNISPDFINVLLDNKLFCNYTEKNVDNFKDFLSKHGVTFSVGELLN